MASDKTETRRARVYELFGKSDRRIADILIEEGFFGALPKTKPAQITFHDSARRTVNRDRDWWREQWAEKTGREKARSETPQEFIARLRTRIEDLEDIAENPMTKPTPRVQAFAEIRQLEQAIAKAQGTDDAAPPDPDAGKARTPVVGLLLGTKSVSPEMRERLREQGINIEDE